jgi:hypothetical protein
VGPHILYAPKLATPATLYEDGQKRGYAKRFYHNYSRCGRIRKFTFIMSKSLENSLWWCAADKENALLWSCACWKWKYFLARVLGRELCEVRTARRREHSTRHLKRRVLLLCYRCVYWLMNSGRNSGKVRCLPRSRNAASWSVTRRAGLGPECGAWILHPES